MKRKENDLNQTPMIMFQPLIFQGVILYPKNGFANLAGSQDHQAEYFPARFIFNILLMVQKFG